MSAYESFYLMMLLIGIPFSCSATLIVVMGYKFYREKPKESKRFFLVGMSGGILGYIIGILYYSLTWAEAHIGEVLNLALVGLIGGGGYAFLVAVGVYVMRGARR